MWSVTVTIEWHEVFRPSEIIADLRTVAETLYFPLKLVGFWDEHAGGMHLCPQERVNRPCAHRRANGDLDPAAYTQAVSRDMGARLHVAFPHAKVDIYLK